MIYRRQAGEAFPESLELETRMGVRSQDLETARRLAPTVFEQAYGTAPQKIGFTLMDVRPRASMACQTPPAT